MKGVVALLQHLCVPGLQVLWSDIGGQEEVKRSMKEAVERPITHPQVNWFVILTCTV